MVFTPVITMDIMVGCALLDDEIFTYWCDGTVGTKEHYTLYR